MKSTIKKTVINFFIGLLLVLGIIFGIYVSDYYHALDVNYAAEHGIQKSEYTNYIVYGDMRTAKKAFIFYPGGKVEAESYEPILTKIADGGVNCILVKMPFRLAVFKSNAAEEVMEDYPEVENWYVGGHSLGGAMAASFAEKNADELSGLILLAAYPTEEIAGELPILSVYGSEDQVLNRDHYKEGINKNPQVEEVVIEGGNHGGFGNYGEQKEDGKAGITTEEQWNETTKEVLDFICNNGNE